MGQIYFYNMPQNCGSICTKTRLATHLLCDLDTLCAPLDKGGGGVMAKGTWLSGVGIAWQVTQKLCCKMGSNMGYSKLQACDVQYQAVFSPTIDIIYIIK